jgi:hypothetical protein
VPRQVRKIQVAIEQLDDGRWRYTMPAAPGWAVVASSPVEPPEPSAAPSPKPRFQPATWHGHAYDQEQMDGPEHRRHEPRSRGGRRSDVYDCREWRLADDGHWIAPRGHRYPHAR